MKLMRFHYNLNAHVLPELCCQPATTYTPHTSNMLMLSWVVGVLPRSRHHAIVCSASSVGYDALRQSLSSLEYPQHTIVLTNVDIRDVPDVSPVVTPLEGAPYSCIVRVEECANPHTIQRLLNTPVYYYKSDGAILHSSSRFREDSFEDDDTYEYKYPRGHSRHLRDTVPGRMVTRDVYEYGVPQWPEQCRTHLSPISNITVLPTQFLSDCTGLTSVSFEWMPHVVIIDDSTEGLRGCSGLQYIDLSSFTEVTTLPKLFLSDCTSLKSIDLSALRNVTEICQGFLKGCSGLEEIDLTPFNKVTTLPAMFLSGCERLTVIDLVPLKNVVEICFGFLKGCSGLREINLTPFNSVKTLPVGFLSHMGFKTIDVSPLQNVTEIPRGFLMGCGGLEVIDLTPFNKVKTLHDEFLSGCKGLKSIDLTPLHNVVEIRQGFLKGCSGLEEIDLTPFSKVTTLHEEFLSGCKGLKSIDLTLLHNVVEIPGGFLMGCCGLECIDFTPMTNVTSIGYKFLACCTGLSSINFTGLEKVFHLPEFFLSGCTSLVTIDMGPLALIHCRDGVIPDPWVFNRDNWEYCTKLQPDNIFDGCPGLKAILNPPIKFLYPRHFKLLHWKRIQPDIVEDVSNYNDEWGTDDERWLS